MLEYFIYISIGVARRECLREFVFVFVCLDSHRCHHRTCRRIIAGDTHRWASEHSWGQTAQRLPADELSRSKVFHSVWQRAEQHHDHHNSHGEFNSQPYMHAIMSTASTYIVLPPPPQSAHNLQPRAEFNSALLPDVCNACTLL